MNAMHAQSKNSDKIYNPTQGIFIHPVYQHTWFKMIKSRKFTRTSIDIWLILSSWANVNEEFQVDIAAHVLMEKFDCGDTTLRESLKSLEDEGYLILKTSIVNYRRHYTLTPIHPRDAEHNSEKKAASEPREKPQLKPDNPCGFPQTAPRKSAGINIIRNSNKKTTLTLASKEKEREQIPESTEISPTSETPLLSEQVYITYEGEVLSLEDIPSPPQPVLPERPIVPGSIFDPEPQESDLEAMKNIMDGARTLSEKDEREAYLKPHQNLLCHLSGWVINQKIFPGPYASYLSELKKDFFTHPMIRLWVKYGNHESHTEQHCYQMALEKAKATAAPPLPPSIVTSTSRAWVNRIQTLIRNFKHPNPKTLLLEIVYHMEHFRPTKISWKTEEERLKINFSLAIRLLKMQSWSTPKGLASRVTRCQEMGGM